MTKKKYNKFLDFVTVLVILFPLLMSLITARCSGSFDTAQLANYVEHFAISNSLSLRIGECINTFGIAFDGAMFNSACVIMSNALLIWLFRLFVAVLTYIPKFALKLINLSIGEKDI